MFFDFLSAVFLGGALFKDACDKTASENNWKAIQSYEAQKRENEIKARIAEQKRMEEAGIHYDHWLQSQFTELYMQYKQYYVDPTIETTAERKKPFGEHKVYYYHPPIGGRDTANPNIVDFPNDTLIAYRYEKCREDFEKLQDVTGVVWDWEYESKYYSMIRFYIKEYPERTYFDYYSGSGNLWLCTFPIPGEPYNFGIYG